MNLKTVATTATKEEIGTACSISSPKNMSITGILLPAPEIPPAFEIAIIKNIIIKPHISSPGCWNSFTDLSSAFWFEFSVMFYIYYKIFDRTMFEFSNYLYVLFFES